MNVSFELHANIFLIFAPCFLKIRQSTYLPARETCTEYTAHTNP